MKSYPEQLVDSYRYALNELEEVKRALQKDPLDPRYTPRNTRYKYHSGHSTVQCAAVIRIGNLEKQQHILRTELRQRLNWLQDFIEKLYKMLTDSDSAPSNTTIIEYLGVDYLREIIEELNSNAKKET